MPTLPNIRVRNDSPSGRTVSETSSRTSFGGLGYPIGLLLVFTYIASQIGAAISVVPSGRVAATSNRTLGFGGLGYPIGLLLVFTYLASQTGLVTDSDSPRVRIE